MDLTKLNNHELLKSTSKAAETERLATSALLHHLIEVERRRLYAETGYSSLFEYCVKALSFSEPQASRRVNAARAMREFPEIESSLNSGSLSLTNLSMAQGFFRREKTLETEQKREILSKLENQSSRDAERILMSNSTQPHLHLTEKIRPVSENLTEIKVVLNECTIRDLERVREILGAKSMADLLEKMARFCRKKLDPLEKESKSTSAPVLKKVPKHSRYISAVTKKAVWDRDQGYCTYTDPASGNRCRTRHRLQIDHIVPFAMGGKNTADNLRLLCPAHNQWKALEVFADKVRVYLPSLP